MGFLTHSTSVTPVDPTILRITVVLVGDSGVGKTSLAMAISRRRQKDLPDPFLPVTFEAFILDLTAEELENSKFFDEIVQQKGIKSLREVIKERKDSIQRVEIAFMDALGAEDYDQLRPIAYYQFADIVLLCAAANDSDSLDKATNKWAPEVLHHQPGAHLILIGTKSDFRGEVRTYHERPFPPSEGDTATKRIGGFASLVGYLECSSSTYEGVERLIATVAWVALHLPMEQTVRYQQQDERKLNSQTKSGKEGCVIL